MIDGGAVDFPAARQLSAWLFENEPDAQGICWTCRQADEGRAALLFAPHVVALGHGPAGGRQGGVDVFVSCRGFVRRRRVSVPPIPGLYGEHAWHRRVVLPPQPPTRMTGGIGLSVLWRRACGLRVKPRE